MEIFFWAKINTPDYEIWKQIDWISHGSFINCGKEYVVTGHVFKQDLERVQNHSLIKSMTIVHDLTLTSQN